MFNVLTSNRIYSKVIANVHLYSLFFNLVFGNIIITDHDMRKMEKSKQNKFKISEFKVITCYQIIIFFKKKARALTFITT